MEKKIDLILQIIIKNYSNAKDIEDFIELSEDVTKVIDIMSKGKKEACKLKNKYSCYIVDFHIK